MRTSGLYRLIKDHLAGGASRLAALLLPQILPVFSVVTPCQPGAARRDLVLVQPIQATGSLIGRGSWLVVLGVLGAAATAAGCRQDMHNQPKYIPLRESAFFDDDRSARPIVAGTVARGQLHEDALLSTGKINGANATVFPFRVDDTVMARGHERFDIYCAPCHGRTGAGDGMVVRRGYRHPPPLYDDRLRAAPVGHFFDVMTNGFGAMPDYAEQIPAADRWAIIAYMRALQLAGHAAIDEVPVSERARLDQPPAPAERAR